MAATHRICDGHVAPWVSISAAENTTIHLTSCIGAAFYQLTMLVWAQNTMAAPPMRDRPAHLLDKAGAATPKVWRAYRQFHRAKRHRPAAYGRFVQALVNADPQFGQALRNAGLGHFNSTTSSIKSHNKQLWSFIRAAGIGERMILHRIVEPYFHGLVNKTDHQLRQWRQIPRTRTTLDSLCRALGPKTPAATRQALHRYLDTRITDLARQTHGNDLELKTLRPGTKRWMHWLTRFTTSPLVGFDPPRGVSTCTSKSRRRKTTSTSPASSGRTTPRAERWGDMSQPQN
ncbi:MAG: hypothetical protein JRH20_31850 [Deltaproteobacteria bacterium]|nr:hypothetical protein [Deltaproteobacteria bacterium]